MRPEFDECGHDFDQPHRQPTWKPHLQRNGTGWLCVDDRSWSWDETPDAAYRGYLVLVKYAKTH